MSTDTDDHRRGSSGRAIGVCAAALTTVLVWKVVSSGPITLPAITINVTGNGLGTNQTAGPNGTPVGNQGEQGQGQGQGQNQGGQPGSSNGERMTIPPVAPYPTTRSTDAPANPGDRQRPAITPVPLTPTTRAPAANPGPAAHAAANAPAAAVAPATNTQGAQWASYVDPVNANWVSVMNAADFSKMPKDLDLPGYPNRVNTCKNWYSTNDKRRGDAIGNIKPNTQLDVLKEMVKKGFDVNRDFLALGLATFTHESLLCDWAFNPNKGSANPKYDEGATQISEQHQDLISKGNPNTISDAIWMAKQLIDARRARGEKPYQDWVSSQFSDRYGQYIGEANAAVDAFLAALNAAKPNTQQADARNAAVRAADLPNFATATEPPGLTLA